jgi:two-component system response regulator GlrR
LISSLDFKQAIKDLNVLISGETGTGKELFAKAVQASAFWHDDNNAAPTASVNVAAFTEGLIDSELFGHKKGAFTGAMQDRDGLLRASHNGTFFLDEVGDLPMGTQVKLLRVIETKKVRPVGSDKEFDADVRYISATNKNILKDKFRGDLYERLAGTVIHLPSLRERSQQDIEEIADVIIRNCLERKEEYSSSDEVIQYLRDREKEKYTWPGNVRELQSFIRGVILGINIGGKSGRWAKPKTIIGQDESEVPSNLIMGKWTEEELKQWYYNKVLALNNNNLNKTARVLNVNPTTLLRRRGKSK